MYITVKEAAKKWEMSKRRIRILCGIGKIDGAFEENNIWKIPSNTSKPLDARFETTESLLTIIDQKKQN